MVITTLAARAGIEYTPYVLPNLLQIKIVSQFLENSEHGQHLIRNSFTEQMMAHFTRIHPQTYGFGFYDFLKDLNNEIEFKKFLNKNESYKEYVQWIEYRLSQSLMRTMEGVLDYGKAEEPLTKLAKETSAAHNFEVYANALLKFQIVESYEQMMNYTSYRVRILDQGEYLTLGYLETNNLPQLQNFVKEKIKDHEGFVYLKNQLVFLFDKKPRKASSDEALSKALYLSEIEMTKDLFRVLMGYKEEMTVDNCNLFFSVVNSDFQLKSDKPIQVLPKRDYSLPPLGEN